MDDTEVDGRLRTRTSLRPVGYVRLLLNEKSQEKRNMCCVVYRLPLTPWVETFQLSTVHPQAFFRLNLIRPVYKRLILLTKGRSQKQPRAFRVPLFN